MVRRIFVALLVYALVVGQLPARAAGVSPVGVVTQAAHANLGSAQVSAGSTVFDGDSFTTASDGLFRVRAGSAQFYLAGQSALKLHSVPGGALAQLTSGTIVFSSAKAVAIDVEIVQAHIRPASDQPTVAQISVAGPKQIDVRAKRGSLQFSYNGETKLIPEGAACRFVLDPSHEDVVVAAANSASPSPKREGPTPPWKPPSLFISLLAPRLSLPSLPSTKL